jgi:RHS repeat-associated protein
VFEPYSFKPLAFIENEKLYYYHLDHLGTPQEITDFQGGIVWSGNYKAYGSLAIAQENAIENNLRFQGQYFDEESGLHYNRFRYYDPGVGQFIHQDPIGLLGGTNNYRYVPNPIGWIDPLGLTPKDCGIKNSPDFVVSPSGTAFPVPKGATGPTPVLNPAGKQTGVAYTGGAGGANGKVSTMRIMDPTPAKGSSPGYPNGYIKYENSASPKPQGVDPYSGKTLPNSQSHFPID